MRKGLVLFVFGILCSTGFSQKMPSDYFSEAVDYFQTEDYVKAAESFKYIVDSCPKYSDYVRAEYNLGLSYLRLKNYSGSAAVLKRMLSRNIEETVEDGGDIMSNPYSNYANSCAMLLSGLYYEKQDYDSSLYYLELADKKYVYQHFCGTEIREERIAMNVRFADLYFKLNRASEAEKMLLQQAFLQESHAESSLALLKEYYKENGNKKKLLKEAQQAFKKMETTIKSENEREYYITFHNEKLLVARDRTYKIEASRKEPTFDMLLNSAFYKMLEGL